MEGLMEMNSVVLWKFSVLVALIGAYGAGTDKKVSVKEGESVTLPTDVTTNQHEMIRWFFNKNRLAEIISEVSKICEDEWCKERFRDRLELDHQTGSLTITNTRTTDSGLYHLEIISVGSDDETTFSVTVNSVSVAERDKRKGTSANEGESGSGLSSAAVTGICVVLVFVAVVVAGVIYCPRYHQRGKDVTELGTRTQRSDQINYTSVKHDDNRLEPDAKETCE